MVVGGGGCSQQLLCLNPTTVLVVLLLGLWLLLGCDNNPCVPSSAPVCYQYFLLIDLDFIFKRVVVSVKICL